MSSGGPGPSDLDSQAPNWHPSALVRLVEARGRKRDGSATPLLPSLLSTTPNRGLEARNPLKTPTSSFKNNNNNNTTPSWKSPSWQDRANSSSRYDSGGNQRGEGYIHTHPSRSQLPSSTPCHGLSNHDGNPPMVQHSKLEKQDPGSNLPLKMPFSQSSSETSLDTSPNGSTGHVSAQFQAILLDVQEKIASTPGIPQAIQESLKKQLLKMGREFNDSRRRLYRDLDQLRAERNTIGGQLDEARRQLGEARRQLDSAIQDRARISTERDNLQLKVAQVGSTRPTKSDEQIGSAERHLRRVNEELVDRIRIQDEQLRGKRALWMDSNPNSASRRRAMSALQDPFGSPTPSKAPGPDEGVMDSEDWPPFPPDFPPSPEPAEQGAASNDPDVSSKSSSPDSPASCTKSPSATSSPSIPSGPSTPPGPSAMCSPSASSGPSSYSGPHSRSFPPNPSGSSKSPNLSYRLGGRRRRSAQLDNPMPGNGPLNSPARPSILRRSNTDPNVSSGATMPNGDDHPSIEFKATISMIYRLMHNWVKEHASKPNIDKEQAIAQSKEQLWGYMIHCTLPGAQKQDAQAHIVSLLETEYTRTWFIMRLALSYCFQDILSVHTFKRFSPEVAKTVENALDHLQERGLANDARQTFVDSMSEAVQSIMDSPTFGTFRQEQLGLHTKHLRDILGSLLNKGCARAKAGRELGDIVIAAWELSIKMSTSRLSFQIYFPETTAKFSAATMHPIDTNVDPVKLQVQQAHLKLVVTPVITMRDDRSTTIKAKNIHLAKVLLMT